MSLIIKDLDTPAGIGLEYLAIQDYLVFVQFIQLPFGVCQKGSDRLDAGKGADIPFTQLGI